MEDKELVAKLNGLTARLLALETVADAVLTVASDYPHLREEIARAIQTNAAATTTARSGDEKARQTFLASIHRFLAALGVDPEDRIG